MQRFKIFPAIGIARLGGSLSDFFLCPENPNSLGTEFDNAGNETDLKEFKDSSGLIKRQGVRFRVFEFDGASNIYKPVDASTTNVEWTVHLANKKAGVVRPPDPPVSAPQLPLPLSPGATTLIVDGGEKAIAGKSQSGPRFDGKFGQTSVFIGELKTDANGNLIILGGHGKSESPSNQAIASYYFSKDWYDDTSDGFVKAKITLPDGSTIDAASSWVVVAPPDFAPDVRGVVTLYDVMEQVAIDSGSWNLILPPSFTYQILPIIERFKNLHWVTDVADFSIPFDNNVLSDTSAASSNQRKQARDKILTIQTILQGHTQPGHPYQLTNSQRSRLDAWVAGNFISDLGNPVDPLNNADRLNKTILDGTVGQGFCPGIEGGIIVKNPAIYVEPFRIDVTKVTPGDITGLMALPWQADFLKCNTNWWPTQRPDVVTLSNNTTRSWAKGITNHKSLIDNFNKLGYVKPKQVGTGLAEIEEERSLP